MPLEGGGSAGQPYWQQAETKHDGSGDEGGEDGDEDEDGDENYGKWQMATFTLDMVKRW